MAEQILKVRVEFSIQRSMHRRLDHRQLVCAALLLCSACNPFAAKQAEPGGTGAAAPAASAPLPPVPASSQSAAAGASGAPAMRRFPVMSTIVPPSKPATAATEGAAGTAAAAPATSTATAAAGAGSEATGAAAGSGAATMGAAGDTAAQPGTPATTETMKPAFDPATFDEAMGRSRGTAPPGTPVEPGGMECPNEVCKPLPALPDQASSMGVMVSLCCTPEGECGSMGSGPMSTEPPMCRIIPDSDPQCARLELMGFEIASCCTADGKCGLNGQNFMQAACGSIEDAMEMFGGFIELPPPAACKPGMGPPLSSSAPAPGTPATTPATTAPTMPAAGAPAMPAAGAGAMPTAGSAAP